ncbi:MAG: hypothetical protein HKN77_07195 [Woeseiaceae bacterium]|nr:hypothetical protein [Woeseiaceae bacterium]
MINARNRIAMVYALVLIIAACASNDETALADHADEIPKCSFDETYSCVERMGKAERCFCADKDTLRELLEPTFK